MHSPRNVPIVTQDDPVSAHERNIVTRVLREGLLASSPSVRVRRTLQGSSLRVTPQSQPRWVSRRAIPQLNLTLAPPMNWQPPDPDTFIGFRAWVTYGVLDFASPSNLHEPLMFSTETEHLPAPGSSRSIKVWMRAGWEGEFARQGTPLWTTLSIQQSPSPVVSPTFPSGPPINTESNPGVAGAGFYDYYIIPLGEIMYHAVALPGDLVEYRISLYQTGAGSFATIPSSFFAGPVVGAVETDPPRADVYISFTFKRFS